MFCGDERISAVVTGLLHKLKILEGEGHGKDETEDKSERSQEAEGYRHRQDHEAQGLEGPSPVRQKRHAQETVDRQFRD